MLKASVSRAGYVSGRGVIEDVVLSIDPGSVVLIAGPSGSGKTTLLLAITGVLKHLLYGFVDGVVGINGVNPLELDGFLEVPRVAGFVLQDPEKQIAMPTPWDEVAFTLENLGLSDEEVSRRSEEFLKRYGLINKAHKHVEELSGGEKRRLTIAAALAHGPEVVFLDEPTASMDPWGIKSIREDVKEFRKLGYVVVIIEHKAKYFLDLVDKVLVLNQGRIRWVRRTPLSDGELSELQGMDVDARPAINVVEDVKELGEVVLKTSDLIVGYGREAIIKSVDIELRRGEVLAVVGRNGSGKTTLLKTLVGAMKPLGGEVVIRGRAFYVPQQPDYIFIKSSLESEISEVSRRTNYPLNELVDLMPWYDSVRKLSPYRLSHGQRRWASIVIAYAYSRNIVLLDEPTTGLDYRGFKELKEVIARLRGKGISFIVATHDPRIVAEVADSVILVEDGRAKYVSREWALNYLEEGWR